MTEKTKYDHGQFSWVDLSSHDMNAASKWYAKLFGWDYQPSESDSMPYGMFFKKGKPVAGIGELNEEMKGQGIPPMWNSYVTVDDAAATEAKAKELGATVTVPTMAAMEFGSMAFFLDKTGASFAVWQPGTHAGAGLVNEDGAFTWSELMTRDLGKATEFYGSLFGWSADQVDMPGGSKYTICKNQGEMNCGMMDMPAEAGDTPDHWAVYFNVADIDATIAAVESSGGKVIVPRTAIPQGAFATFADPQGAVFSAIQPTT